MSSMSVNITKKNRKFKAFLFRFSLITFKMGWDSQRVKASQFFIKNPFVKEAPIQ